MRLLSEFKCKYYFNDSQTYDKETSHNNLKKWRKNIKIILLPSFLTLCFLFLFLFFIIIYLRNDKIRKYTIFFPKKTWKNYNFD